jgi:hypothetical protein
MPRELTAASDEPEWDARAVEVTGKRWTVLAGLDSSIEIGELCRREEIAENVPFPDDRS